MKSRLSKIPKRDGNPGFTPDPMKMNNRPFPLATALRASLKNYDVQTFRQDLIGGIVVSLIALPLSMALSIAVGLPPQHGLYTAIVAGVVAALLGGSSTQVSGPTAAFVVIVAPIVTNFGLHGIIWCQILAGIILIAMGSARLGRLITYVPYPVTTGFTSGIAVTIATLSLNDFLGLGIENLQGHYIGKAMSIAAHLPGMKPEEFAVGLATLLTFIFFPKITTKIPSPVAGIALGTALAWAFSRSGMPVDTLNTRFSFEIATGGTGHGIPPYPPMLHIPGGSDALFKPPDYLELKRLLMPSFVIAMLAALESLLAATVADSMARTRHDPNAELNGIGIANIFSGLVAGIPATGAIARTATSIHAGGKTPIAAVIHALLILFYMLVFAPWISHIPMAALAALLLMTAWRMSHIHQFGGIIRTAPRSDIAVLLICFLLTVFIDMVAGVSIGIILACLLFMKRVADITHVDISPRHQVEESPQDSLPPGVMTYRIEGPLFFGSADKVLAEMDFINNDVRKLVLDLTQVPLIDATGMASMKTFLSTIAHEGRNVVVCGKKSIVAKIMQEMEDHPKARFLKTAGSLNDALRLEI